MPELGSYVADLPPPLASDPETERYRLFDAVARWLASLCEASAVVFILDDLQWASRPTLLLLRYVLQWPEPLRLLVSARVGLARCPTTIPSRRWSATCDGPRSFDG